MEVIYNNRYFSEKRDVIELAAEMISKSRVIGWFQNKMEFDQGLWEIDQS